MKSTTPQPVFARGSDSGSSFAENALSFSKRIQQHSKVTHLVLRNESGQITHRWPLTHTKCTIGSSDSCSVVCTLPGIEPLNAIVVNGAKQAFVRGLSANLSQDGVATNELLLTDRKGYFELAGHRFELIRQADKPTSTMMQPSRLRFTSARPFEMNRPSTASRYATPVEPNLPSDLADAPWLRGLIERTIEPLEAQISSLLMPVQEYQTQVLQAQQLQNNQTNQEQQKQAALTQEISSIVARQSATMESLGERLRDVNQQLETIERIIAEDSELESKAKDGLSQDMGVQRVAIDQLQTGMVAVSESLNQLHDRQHSMQDEYQGWKEEIQERLDNLSRIVAEIKDCTNHRADSEILSAVQSLQQSHLLAQEEVQRWQYGLHDQLEALEKKITEIPSTSVVASSGDSISHAGPFQVEEQSTTESTSLESELENDTGSNNDWLDQWTTIQPSDPSEDSIGADLDEPIPEFISDLPPMESAREEIEAIQDLHEQTLLDQEEPEFALTGNSDDPGHSHVDHVQDTTAREVSELVWDDALETSDSDVDYAPTILTDSARLVASQNQIITGSDSENLQDSRNLLQWNQNEVEWSQLDSKDSSTTDRDPLQSDCLVEATSRELESFEEQGSPLEEISPNGISAGESFVSESLEQITHLPTQSVAAKDADADFFFGSTQLETPQEQQSKIDSFHELSNETDSKSTEGRPSALPSWWMDDEAEDSEFAAMEGQLNASLVDDQQIAEARGYNIALPEQDSVEGHVESVEQHLGEFHALDDEEFADDDHLEAAIELQQVGSTALVSRDSADEKADDTSVEQYMRDLLTRMRGSQTEFPEVAETKPKVTSVSVSKIDANAVANPSKSVEEVVDEGSEESFDSDNYISLTNAPEKSKNIHALRDLANNSARQAIRKSTRQRYISTSLLKLAICVIALTVSGVLFSINGLELNIGLVATFASLLVAAIWGYDAIAGLRPLLKTSLVLAPPDAAESSDTEEE